MKYVYETNENTFLTYESVLVPINPLKALTYQQVGSCTFPHGSWNRTKEFSGSPSFEILDSGLIEKILYTTRYFVRISLRVNKSIFFQRLTEWDFFYLGTTRLFGNQNN